MDLQSFDLVERATCFAPFLPETDYADSKGFIGGRLCSNLTGPMCCLPCPLTDWVYPDNFDTLGTGAEWVSVVGTICCVLLLLSWACLPVEKTHRHYLSICLTMAVTLMNLGFVIPLAGHPQQCADAITPNGMKSSSVCAASGAFVILGGWAGVMWVFLRALSLHLQICWQVVVGRSFMYFSNIVGWGIPALGVVLALVFSGVSFRFGNTCHINHKNSLADLWIPLLVFAGLTIVIQFVTFGYCIKVYLASLADNSSSTEGSGLPSYSNSIRTMTPRQAYRRVRRVIQLQWRGIAIVLIIIADVIFFSIVFVFQDNIVAHLSKDPTRARTWLTCLALNSGNKSKCLQDATKFSVNQATIGAVLILLACNGIWLLVLLGRWSMVTGWMDLVMPAAYRSKQQREFVSVDARLDDLKKDTRSYEMLSRDASSAGRSAKANGIVTSFSSETGASSVPSSAFAPGQAALAGSAPAPVPGPGPVPRPSAAASGPPRSMSPRSIRSATPVMGLGAIAGMGTTSEVTSQGRSGRSGSLTRSPSDVSYTATAYAGSQPPPGYGHSPDRSPDHSHSHTQSSNGGGGGGGGRRTPDYFGQTARYNAPSRSFSSPRPPTSGSATSSVHFESRNRSPPPRTYTMRSHDEADEDRYDTRHPLGMNRL